MSALCQKRTLLGLALFGDRSRRSRQDNPDFREFAGLCIDLDQAAMLLDDDVMTYGKAEAGAFTGWLGRKKWIEHLFLHVRLNPGAIVADPDLHTVAKIFRRGTEGRSIDFAVRQSFIPRCIEVIRRRKGHAP